MATQTALWTQPQDARIDDARSSFFPPRGAAHTTHFVADAPDSTTAATKIRTSASPAGSSLMKLHHFPMQGEPDMPASKISQRSGLRSRPCAILGSEAKGRPGTYLDSEAFKSAKDCLAPFVLVPNMLLVSADEVDRMSNCVVRSGGLRLPCSIIA